MGWPDGCSVYNGVLYDDANGCCFSLFAILSLPAVDDGDIFHRTQYNKQQQHQLSAAAAHSQPNNSMALSLVGPRIYYLVVRDIESSLSPCWDKA